MIKIAHKTEAEVLNKVPSGVTAIVVEIATILDDNYGKEREDNDLGGYILIAEDEKDVEAIKSQINLNHTLPEYVDLIKCFKGESYTSSLILLSSDYSISLIIPLGLTPKELLKFMEE